MALKTLEGVKEINGRKVVVMDELREQFPDKFNESGAMDYKWFEQDIRPNAFIYVRNDKNSISFTMQNGPIGENGNGVNGCQIDDIIATAKTILEGLNEQVRNNHNIEAIKYLGRAMSELEARRLDRVRRGVEGTSQL
jgi:hypothetical protein